MHVLVVNEAMGQNASYLARCANYLRGLERLGIHTTAVPYQRDIWKRIRHDVIWWRRIGVDDAEATELANARARIVYDFDDAVYEMPDDLRVPGWERSAPMLKRRFENISRLALGILAGSEYLANQCENAAQRCVIWRTGVTESAFVDAAERRGFVWTGSKATLPYLEGARDVIEAVRARTGDKLVVVCDAAPSLDADWMPWKHETQAAPLGRALVGFAPLPHTAYAHGKCGFKIVQYMAAGLPVVASKVPAHEELFAAGCEGVLSDDTNELADALAGFIERPEVARRLGERNREIAREHFSTTALLPGLAQALTQALTLFR